MQKPCEILLTEDEVLVLFEYFERVDKTGDLAFSHPAEYLALQRIAAQVCKGTSAMFLPNYNELLEEAQERVAAGFEGSLPGQFQQDEA